RLREVGGDGRELVIRLAGAQRLPDPGQEVARVVPGRAERGAGAVGDEAAAAAAGPDGPLLVAHRPGLVRRAVRGAAAGYAGHRARVGGAAARSLAAARRAAAAASAARPRRPRAPAAARRPLPARADPSAVAPD